MAKIPLKSPDFELRKILKQLLEGGTVGYVLTADANGDVSWAFSEGRAISLFFHSQNPDIETVFVDRTSRPERLHTGDSRVFFYDYNGHVYTMDEVMEGRDERGRLRTQ